MSKFVKNADTINFCTALVTHSEVEGVLLPAATKGGSSSRTGLTRTPTWKEENSFPILRKREFLFAVEERREVQPYYFIGHGARKFEIHKADTLAISAAISAWNQFRKTGLNQPNTDTEESRLARSHTLRGFREGLVLTFYEAEEMLPRVSEWASMEVDDEGYVHIASSKGTAYREAAWGYYMWIPQGTTHQWVSEFDGWAYRNRYHCTEKDQRWFLERWRDENGTHLHEWEVTEDQRNWTASLEEAREGGW